MMQSPLALARSDRGAAAAEFSLVLPLFLLLLFGIIDVGRFMWEYNRAEKATQVGARMAAVTSALSPDLISANFADADVKPGDLIPATALGTVTCASTGCTCTKDPCPFSSGSVDTSTLTSVLLPRMQAMKPDITAANIRVSYSGSGFGFAGSPPTGGGGGSTAEKMEISPLVTVSLEDVQFTPITALLLTSVTMPGFSTTVPAEDLSGSYSN